MGAVNGNLDRPSKQRWRPMRTFLAWLTQQVGGAFIGAVVGAGATALLLAPGREPVAAQLDSQLSDAAQAGFTVSVNREADLHGTGIRSRLVVLKPATGSPLTSDEVRIYDEIDNELRLRYTARPMPGKGMPGYRFTVLGVGRYDHTDREVVLASLDQRFADGRPPHPVALLWNAAGENYEMRALLPRVPALPKGNAGVWGKGARRFYRRTTDVPLGPGQVLRNLRGAGSVRAGRNVLVAGYVLRSPCNACPAPWKFVAWPLNFQDPELAEYPCAVSRKSAYTARIDSFGDIRRAERVVLERNDCSLRRD